MKRLCVVIVNFNTAELARDCIESLLPQLDAAIDRIVVVDNASKAAELKLLSGYRAASRQKSVIDIIPLPENNGFSAGNNAGIASCQASLYLLTNTDTVFVAGAIAGLLHAAYLFPSAGLISPRLQYPNGEAQVSCFRFHSPASELIHSARTRIITELLGAFNVPVLPVSSPSHPAWTSFACVLVRKAVFDSVGLLDDGFFMYYEDTDYCRRARKAGFDIVNWPYAKVIHLRGGSSDVDERERSKKALPDYCYHSRSRYYRKYYGLAGPLFANICWFLGRSVSLSRQILGNADAPVPNREFLNIWKHSVY